MSGKKLQITTLGPDRHYHLVYINPDEGIGGMSPAKDGHVHELIYDPPREMRPPSPAIPPQIDPMTGQPVMVQDPNTGQVIPDPGTPEDPGDPGKEIGTWIISPAGEDFHTHELMDYEPSTKKTKEDDKQIWDDCMALWREGLALEADSRKKGKEAEDFYAGKQWDDSSERWLNSLDRAALTINEIAPGIDTLRGYQMEQRTDWKFLPREGGDQRVADMLNILVKQISDACAFPREESKVFKDAIVAGKGDYHVYMDFNENIQGDIIIERFPWDSIVRGPHEKEDLRDCEFEIRDRMYSIAKLKQLFRKKAKEIEENYRAYSGQYPDVDKDSNGIAGTHTDYKYAKKVDDIPFMVNGTLPLVDVQKKQFRLVQCTRKVYVEVSVIFNVEEDFFFTAYDWEEEDIALVRQIPGFQTITQLKARMRITKFCGSTILSDENPADLPLHDFYTVPVYAYRQNGEFWGKVEAAKDPQRELNKRRSQAMDTMNRLGASVYYIPPDTFKDNNEKERFKKNRSKPGSMFDINNENIKPILEEGAEFPAALVELMQLDQTNLQRLLNVTVNQAGANESGAMFLEKKKNLLTGNQFIFDNAAFAKQKLGKIIAALIQRYYSPERCERILNAQYSKAKFQVGGQDYAQYSKEEIIEMLECTDMLEYDVVVTESAFAASTRLGIAQMLFDAISKGAQIPIDLAIRFTDIPADVKAEIGESLQAQQQQMAQTAADTSNSEITKTLIAKGQYTVSPEKANELGLVPADPGLQNGQSSNNNQISQENKFADNLVSPLAG